MIPNKKRAQRLDDRLRELGFHARASGIYKTATAAVEQQAISKSPGTGGEPETTGNRSRRRGGGGSAASSKPLTQEEKQESMAKMVEACKKKRPGTAGGGAGEVEHRCILLSLRRPPPQMSHSFYSCCSPFFPGGMLTKQVLLPEHQNTGVLVEYLKTRTTSLYHFPFNNCL